MFTVGAYIFVAIAVYAALSDLATRRVRNAVNGTFFVAGLAFQLAVAGPSGLGAALLGAALGLLVLIVPFQRKWMGAGDVKFLAAAGAWLGPQGVLLAGAIGLGLAGLWAIAMMIARPSLGREAVRNLRFAAVTLSDPHISRRANRDMIPLVVPLACAVIATGLGGAL